MSETIQDIKADRAYWRREAKRLQARLDNGVLVRETYDENLYGDEGKVLDEIVADRAAVHIERLSKRWWMCIIEVDGEYIYLNIRDLNVYERTSPVKQEAVDADTKGAGGA